ncbi:TetR/AcrR family transcriptional regulator [Desulfohalovibrio reitneri]|uniref:TetR/AcrR family transcriptional regulator n=1 Tax=Desulfohalovibrio reitneri TaxID=1307759 RepID=UPI00068DB109|nr:TetR family transcriptional regulator [Desulfohalovibrio reitneri]
MAKVIPITKPRDTRDKCLEVVLDLLAERGYSGLSLEAVAARASVETRVLHRLFGGLQGLVLAAGETDAHWPDLDELQSLASTPADPEEQVAVFYEALLEALAERPRTARILAWELVDRSPHAELMERKRVRTSLEWFEALPDGLPEEEADLGAVVAVLAAACSYLALRAGVRPQYGGVDLRSPKGRGRLAEAFRRLTRGLFAPE